MYSTARNALEIRRSDVKGAFVERNRVQSNTVIATIASESPLEFDRAIFPLALSLTLFSFHGHGA